MQKGCEFSRHGQQGTIRREQSDVEGSTNIESLRTEGNPLQDELQRVARAAGPATKVAPQSLGRPSWSNRRGEAAPPPALLSSSMPITLTRRQFLVVGGAVAAAVMTRGKVHAFGGGLPAAMIFRLSLRGRRGSQAARKHNANLRFASAAAADINRAHPGDRSRIVAIVVSGAEFHRLFPEAGIDVADLRRLGPATLVGDCDGNGRVSVDELIRGVNIALGEAPVDTCTPFDRRRDGRVTVDDLVLGVRNAID